MAFSKRFSRGDELEIGDVLAGYRLEEVLGEGGMGRVFRARREDDGSIVALKVVKPSLARDEQYIRRFSREARAASEVSHKHLVGVLEAGEDDGRRFLAMRYVPGRSLDDRIRDIGPLPIDETVSIACQVAAGLDVLHGAGVIHRDVKPSNIMLDADGCACLTDFGLAKGAQYSAVTKAGQVLGTLDYLAPEMIRGADPSPASDIYALGCVVFECLAGSPPFGGRHSFEVGLAHLEDQPPDPCAARADAPDGFSEIVLYALAKQPERRPPTAAAYARLLTVASRASGRAA